jgi:hypothetical protein
VLVACVAVLDLLTHPHTRSGLEHMLFARVGLMLTLLHCGVPSPVWVGVLVPVLGVGFSFRVVVLITHFMAGVQPCCVLQRGACYIQPCEERLRS